MAGDQMLARYADALVRRRFARTTVHRRVVLARAWIDWIGPNWPVATWHDVDDYGDVRSLAGVCPATWRNEVSHLSNFYRWAMRNELADRDPTVLVERPRIGQYQPRPASEVYYRRLLDGATPVMVAIIELMVWCGLRCCEVARLRWQDVDLIERTALVQGKGDRERYAGLPHQVVRALAAIDDGEGFVIKPPGTARGGRPGAAADRISANRLSQMVGEWCRHQGVKVTAHQLRHRFATVMLDAAEGDLLVVRDAMGHADVSTTQVYAQVSRRRAQAAARTLDRYTGYSDPRLFDL